MYAAQNKYGYGTVISVLRRRALRGECYYADFFVEAFAGSSTAEGQWIAPLYCIPELPEPPDPDNCPILVDLGLDGFHLSGPDPSVSFDIDADGSQDQIAWTRADGNDAFLCLDRNLNGVIDNGQELFGYATPLLSGAPAVVGYRALAELDLDNNGGNADGRIDAADAMFAELCVWLDTDRDGYSDPAEISPLHSSNVVAMEYDYSTTRLRDRYGNLFRYTAPSLVRESHGRVHRWPTYDVIFANP